MTGIWGWCTMSHIRVIQATPMGWLRWVGTLKLQVSFPECRLFYRAFLQKSPIILRSLLIVAIPYEKRQVTRKNEVWNKCEWVKSHIWMRNVTNVADGGKRQRTCAARATFIIPRCKNTYATNCIRESRTVCMMHDLCICVLSRESYLYYTAPLKHIRHELYMRVTNYVYVARSLYICRQPREPRSLHRAARTYTPRTIFESHELCICCPTCVYMSSAARATFFTLRCKSGQCGWVMSHVGMSSHVAHLKSSYVRHIRTVRDSRMRVSHATRGNV